jgi:4-amino-4-deoxy-L-arabinose transferase-like glycosyltransferase
MMHGFARLCTIAQDGNWRLFGLRLIFGADNPQRLESCHSLAPAGGDFHANLVTLFRPRFQSRHRNPIALTSKLLQLPAEPSAEPRFFRLALPLVLAVRLLYAGQLLLIPDEAFYWVLSRHLSAGYLDHPPMIAYLICIGTQLVGNIELGVRLMAVLMCVGALGLIVALAKRVLQDTRSVTWVAVIWLTSPLLAAWGTIFTPDTPAMFFSLCALICAAVIALRDDQAVAPNKPQASSILAWVGFGFFSGMAMVSKYTGVLMPFSVALAMLFSRTGRTHYRRPWIYLSGILALIVFSPVIWWNATHGWVSFLFQLHHGTDPHQIEPAVSVAGMIARFFSDLSRYIGGQFLIWTPVLFVIAIVVLLVFWRRELSGWCNSQPSGKDRPKLNQVDRLMLWCGTVPLVLFGLAVLRSHHTEANWPGFAYFPISLLTVRWFSENWQGQRRRWAYAAVQTALIGLVGVHVILYPTVTKAMVKLPIHLPHALLDFVGWREYGRWLGEKYSETGAPLLTNKHQDAAEAMFYMPGQPEQVWCVSTGTRPTAFDYFDEGLNFEKMPPEVLWIGGNEELFCKTYGYKEVERFTDALFFGTNERIYTAYLLVRSGSK